MQENEKELLFRHVGIRTQHNTSQHKTCHVLLSGVDFGFLL